MPKPKLPKFKFPKIKFPKIKLPKFTRKFFLSKRFLIGIGVACVIAVGGIFIVNGTTKDSMYTIARSNIAEARFFMKHAHTPTMCVQFYVGKRESNFARDGIATHPVNFAIVNVEVDPAFKNLTQITGTIRIANEQYEINLLQNPYNPLNFTNDIIKSLRRPATAADSVEVTFFLASNNHPVLQLHDAFKDGDISWSRALRIAVDTIGNRLKNQKFEVFVTIMHETAKDCHSFWYIQFVTEDGQTHFCVVAPDGSVIS